MRRRKPPKKIRTSRGGYSRRTSTSKPKLSINVSAFLKILFVLLIITLCSYLIIWLINFYSVESIDYTSMNSSSSYLLGKSGKDLNKTLIIFESGKDDKRKISKAYVYIRNSKKKLGMLLYIPENLYFNELEEDFGNKIPVSSLRYAGDFLQKGRGVEYALWQFNQLLGIKYDSYIWFTTESLEVFRDIYGDMSDSVVGKNLYQQEKGVELTDSFLFLNTLSSKYSITKSILKSGKFKDLKGNIYSNLSFPKIARLLNDINSQMSEYSMSALTLENSKYTNDENSNSGDVVKVLNTVEYDKEFRRKYSKMVDKDLEKERVRIEVYNASTISGIAAQLGRKIINSGGDVVRYGNAPELAQKTKVFVPNIDDFQNSYSLVAEILSEKYEIINGRPEFMTTGDIIIVIGEDMRSIYSF